MFSGKLLKSSVNVKEVQRAFQFKASTSVAAPEEPYLTYAAVARRLEPAAWKYFTPPRRHPEPKAFRSREGQPQLIRTERTAPKKTVVWRTADRRPLCYHSGEADHIYRQCSYRQLGLPRLICAPRLSTTSRRAASEYRGLPSPLIS